MEWQTIPGFDAYEINKRGQVRIRDTRYPIVRKGNSYMLSADGKRRRVRVDSLLSMAFPQPEAPEVQNQAEPEQATPHPAVTRLQETLAECERLSLRVRELEIENKTLLQKAEERRVNIPKEEWLAKNTIQCKRMRARIRRTMCGTRNECEGCKHRFAQLKEQN